MFFPLYFCLTPFSWVAHYYFLYPSAGNLKGILFLCFCFSKLLFMGLSEQFFWQICVKGRLISETRGRDRRVVWVCVWTASLCLRAEAPDLFCAGGNGALTGYFTKVLFKKSCLRFGLNSCCSLWSPRSEACA